MDPHLNHTTRHTDNLHTSIMGKAEAAETGGDESGAKLYKAGE
jgi:hypothetical protein